MNFFYEVWAESSDFDISFELLLVCKLAMDDGATFDLPDIFFLLLIIK